MPKLTVIKIGGKVIDNRQSLETVLEAFAAIPGRKILVHGGGSLASRMEESLGLVPEMVQGRRVTSKESLDVVTMVYAGLINKNIVAVLQGFGSNGIGLSGADGNTIRTKRRDPEPIDFGYVGDVDKIDAAMLDKLIDIGLVPVVSAITHDGDGQLLNTNADTMASEIAKAMAASNEVELILAFEKPGVLDESNKVIPEINQGQFEKLRASEVIIDGMIPKLTNSFSAIENGVKVVKLVSSEYLFNREVEHTTVIKS